MAVVEEYKKAAASPPTNPHKLYKTGKNKKR